MNGKRVQRTSRKENLGVRSMGGRRRSEAPQPVRSDTGRVNERWSLDLVSDTLSNGRRSWALTVIDEYRRECPAIEVAHSSPAERLIQVWERLRKTCGPSEVIIADNGPEFRSRAFDAEAYARCVKLECIQPGKPLENPFFERLGGSPREDCLNQHCFTSLGDASRTIEGWREDYNEGWSHSSLGNRTPSDFAGGVHPEASASNTHAAKAGRK